MEAGERLPLGKGVREAHNYDSFAEAYSAENEASLFNAYYERPATLALAGDVAGRRVLDAGPARNPMTARHAAPSARTLQVNPGTPRPRTGVEPAVP
jgi:hypothetical protein